jgi:hypothetical protein
MGICGYAPWLPSSICHGIRYWETFLYKSVECPPAMVQLQGNKAGLQPEMPVGMATHPALCLKIMITCNQRTPRLLRIKILLLSKFCVLLHRNW